MRDILEQIEKDLLEQQPVHGVSVDEIDDWDFQKSDEIDEWDFKWVKETDKGG